MKITVFYRAKLNANGQLLPFLKAKPAPKRLGHEPHSQGSLFLNYNTPLVLLFSVHDVHQPAFDQASVMSAFALRHGNLEILVFVRND